MPRVYVGKSFMQPSAVVVYKLKQELNVVVFFFLVVMLLFIFCGGEIPIRFIPSESKLK